ncbi:MAG: hypothetical protein KDD78_10615, partial [Caldilineaceae bacterium]|nr:hypothetical protein [Caldilineaceae bacterium]
MLHAKRFSKLGLVLILALALSACQPIVAPAAQSLPAAPREPHGLRPDAPAYAIQGPYAVGVQNFEIEAANETERPLTVTVWYPAVNSQGLNESIAYEMGFPAGDTPNFSVVGNAIETAVPATATEPYPLVVYSHSHYSFRQESPWLAEHLASQGFVVISADHEDNWSTLFGPKPWQAEFRRPHEVRRELDFAERLTAEDGDLAGVVDMEHAAVTGWSYGANTALVAAGARLDMESFRTWCEDNTVNGEPPDTDCTDILNHEAELATLAGLDAVPEGLWPDWSDERIDAVIALAPWPRLMVPTGLQSVDVPTLLMIGSGDTSVGSTYNEIQPFEQIAAAKKSEIVFDSADHFIFFSDCGDAPEVVDLGLHVFCSDPVWDMDRAHDLI